MDVPPLPERPERFLNVLPEQGRAFVYEFLNLPGWETGWKSNAKRDGYSFLHKHFAGQRDLSAKPYNCADELREKLPVIYGAWESVAKLLPDHRLVRCYANGMPYGMEGTVHVDATELGNYTAVYYPHERWSPNWGGETIFYNDRENRIVACFLPKPNSMVVFDGRMPHRASGVTRSYPGMRITLMFKTEKQNAAAVQRERQS